jgi:hypothetical protein
LGYGQDEEQVFLGLEGLLFYDLGWEDLSFRLLGLEGLDPSFRRVLQALGWEGLCFFLKKSLSRGGGLGLQVMAGWA